MISGKIRTAQGMEGACGATGIPCMATAAPAAHSMPSLPLNPPDPEVPQKSTCRRFTVEYKLNILQQAGACRDEMGIGALLRKDGLHPSRLTTWRRQRDTAILSGLKPKQRGRKGNPIHPLQAADQQLRKGKSRLQRRLKKAELIIDIQKKISQMLGTPHDSTPMYLKNTAFPTPEYRIYLIFPPNYLMHHVLNSSFNLRVRPMIWEDGYEKSLSESASVFDSLHSISKCLRAKSPPSREIEPILFLESYNSSRNSMAFGRNVLLLGEKT